MLNSIQQNTKQAKMRTTTKSKVPKKKALVPVSEVGPAEANINMSLKWTCDPQWAACFIPSLTQVLYTSHKPFENFKWDSAAFLKIVQEVFDISFPHIEYALQPDDTLVGEVHICFLCWNLESITDEEYPGL